MAPSKVNERNQHIAFKNLYECDTYIEALQQRKAKPKLKTGDTVRMAYVQGKHDKGYTPNWTDHIYTIDKTIKGDAKPYYQIKDYSGDVVKERLYPEEVQKVKEGGYRIEKILKRRMYKGKRQVYVKWYNFPSKFNEWINLENLSDLI